VLKVVLKNRTLLGYTTPTPGSRPEGSASIMHSPLTPLRNVTVLFEIQEKSVYTYRFPIILLRNSLF
jgi:hypothetical protein